MKVISKLIDYILIIALGVMSVIVFLNVILRYAFHSGITWSVELSQILFLVLVLLGAIQAFQEDGHIKVDVLISRVPDRWKKILMLITNAIIFYIVVVLLMGSVELVKQNTVLTTPILGIPQSWIYAVGVFFSLCLAILLLIKTVGIFINKGAKE